MNFSVSDGQLTDSQEVLIDVKMVEEEIGLVYFGARFYDPEVSRFISVDPNKQGSNWYSYCFNNPLKMIDPDGKDAIVVTDRSNVGGFGHIFIIAVDPKTSNGRVYSFNPAKVDITALAITPAKVDTTILAASSLTSKDSMVNALYQQSQILDNSGSKDVSAVWVPISAENTNKMISYLDKTVSKAGFYNLFFRNCGDFTLKALIAGGETVWKLEKPGIEIPNCLDYTFSCYYNYDPYNWGDQGTSSSTSSSSSTSGGKKIICAELYRQGLMDKIIYEADEEFGELLKDKYPIVLTGYQVWARPVVSFMKKSKSFTRCVYFVVKPWSYEMAYMMGKREKGNLVGKILMSVGFMVCWLIGIIVTNTIHFLIFVFTLISTLVCIKARHKGKLYLKLKESGEAQI